MSIGPLRRNQTTAHFLDAANDGVFLIKRCAVSDDVLGPQAVLCPYCGSPDLEWIPAKGSARVVSWTIGHSLNKETGSTERTVLALGELDEGPWWCTQIVDVDPAEVQPGIRLRIEFRRRRGFEPVPVYVPVEGSGRS